MIRNLLLVITLTFLSLSSIAKSAVYIPFSHLSYHLEFETRSPFKYQGASKYFFSSGFRNIPVQHSVSQKTAIIRFFSYRPQDEPLEMVLHKLPGLKKKISLNLYLNEHFLKRIDFSTKTGVHIVLPKKNIKRGINLFKFELITPIPEVNKRSLSFSDSVYSIESFRFLKKPDFSGLRFKGDTHFQQPAQSLFRIAVNSAKNRSVSLKIKSMKGHSFGRLLVRQVYPEKPDIPLIDLYLPPRESFSQILNLPPDQQIILEFDYTNSDHRSVLEWDEVSLLTPQNTGKPKKRHKILPLTPLPHIFLLVIDAARDLINQGNKYHRVIPNIARFSNHSTRFTNFFVNAPFTCPSVATMLSGLPPETHTDLALLSILPPMVKTLPVYLKSLGYQSQIIAGNSLLIKHKHHRFFDSATLIRPINKGMQVMQTSFNDLEKALKKIKEINPDDHQFTYLHFLPPHGPYRIWPSYQQFLPKISGFIPPGFLKPDDSMKFKLTKTEFNDYLKNYSHADYLVGEVLNLLKKKGIYDQSLIIICSDHGEAFGEHGVFGHISTIYNGMIKIPFLIKMPFQKKPKTVENPHSLIDLLPSIAHLLNIPEESYWQGQSFFNPSASKNIIYSRASGDGFNCSLIDYPFKYIFNEGREELFNLKEDHGETINLFNQNPYKSLMYKQKLFLHIRNNLNLKDKLGIEASKEKITRDLFIKELKALGYL